MMKNYYLVLGVPRDEQDQRGIRDAYRQLAKQYHPDRAGPEGATAFRDVVEAYEVLSHDEQRALHDQGLRRAESRLDVAPDSIVLADDVPPEPLAPVPVSIPRGFGHVGPSPEELLDRVLHNLLTARASKAERLQALAAELVLSAAEVERGGVVRLGVPVSGPARVAVGPLVTGRTPALPATTAASSRPRRRSGCTSRRE